MQKLDNRYGCDFGEFIRYSIRKKPLYIEVILFENPEDRYMP